MAISINAHLRAIHPKDAYGVFLGLKNLRCFIFFYSFF